MKKKKLLLTRTTITALTSTNLRHVRGGGDELNDSYSCDERTGCCAGVKSYKEPTTIIVLCGDPSQAICDPPP